ncbi:MAG: hypothetical protein FWG63_03640 [Defluviitaleaceae bacterium]|nr:hypothetical protein [Defluviitaleaceae bacterium]
MFNIIKTRELNIKEIFEISFNIYKAKLNLILVYSTIISIITLSFEFSALYILGSVYEGSIEHILANSMPFLAGTLISGTMLLVSTDLVLKFIQQREFTGKDIILVYKLFPKFVLTTILMGLIMIPITFPAIFAMGIYLQTFNFLFFIGSIIFFIILLRVAVGFVFYTNVMAHRGKWGITSIFESRRLVRDNWGKTFLVIFVVFLTTIIFLQILMFIVGAFGLPGILQFVFTNFFAGYLSVYAGLTICVLYFNRYYLMRDEDEIEEEEEEEEFGEGIRDDF